MASPEHQQLVAALTAAGTVLTPTTAPSAEARRQMRESEASAGLVIPDGTTVVPCRYGTVDCLRPSSWSTLAGDSQFDSRTSDFSHYRVSGVSPARSS